MHSMAQAVRTARELMSCGIVSSPLWVDRIVPELDTCAAISGQLLARGNNLASSPCMKCSFAS
jgi:hypothetical protein